MSEMCDINNVVVKQEVTEDETNNQETYILPDRDISDIKQELTDGETMNKETDELQPSCSKTSVETFVKQETFEDEPHISKEETCILPDTDMKIKQEDMELADGEETDEAGYKLQPSCSKTSTQILGESAHICDICGKSFSRDGSLKVHIKTEHEGKRSHVCKVCDKSFTQHSHLKTHVESVHEGARTHVCSVCGKSFGHRSNLNQHISTVH